ncbi:MAG: Histidyl-tRNA synthetase [Candidatus Methanohalarchaeum thermophilum]|uniref:Histidine--tRNA ligase n=1 Tax=Methanohalarchaeum thermophilum TaxID=1903181 RepID=A0A1Q6DUT2_METT1|nr:MAG: Histidyl-tRNA synthetase [Candidatus Methanohalarchaeum thermophilum]
MEERNKVKEKMKNLCTRCGYQEVKTPTFEKLKLFKLKSGEEIVEDIYKFEDKGGRGLALRPELTAPIMRFYSNELKSRTKPIKLFYFSNCFRYEQPQKGRYREFWQFGTEILGGKTLEADAEVISLADSILRELNLEFDLKIGHLGVIRELLKSEDIEEDAQDKIMSVMDKEDVEELKTVLNSYGITKEIKNKLIKLFGLEGEPREILDKAGKILEGNKSVLGRLSDLDKLIDLLDYYGVSDFSLDLGIARGLDYYTGIVFEAFVPGLGAQNQVCGGGSYEFPEFVEGGFKSTGFAIGFDRIMDALEIQGEKIQSRPRSMAYIVPVSEEFREESMKVLREARKSFPAEIDLQNRGIGAQLSHINKLEIPYAILIGEEEVKKDKVSLKDMKTGDQDLMELKDAINKIKSKYKEYDIRY